MQSLIHAQHDVAAADDSALQEDWMQQLLWPQSPAATPAAAAHHPQQPESPQLDLQRHLHHLFQFNTYCPLPAASCSTTASLVTSDTSDSELLSPIQQDQRSRKRPCKLEIKKVMQPKVALETKSDTDILDDGYRWRKYGQKPVKNSKHPRSYYKCSMVGCGVKKRVERSTLDPSIVVTTYHNLHNHSRPHCTAL